MLGKEMIYGMLTTYIHDEDTNFCACIIIASGGGYSHLSSDLVGKIVAEEFYRRGYNTFVLAYTTRSWSDVPLKLQPLKDLARAVAIIRDNADLYRTYPNKLVIYALLRLV